MAFPERREPDLLERHRREVEHARAAELLLAVDMVDVLVGAVADALLRDGQHLVAGPVPQRIRGARLDAGRRRDRVEEALGLVGRSRLAVEGDRSGLARAVGAVRALVDFRRELVPLRGRHVPGAREHAVAAADALVHVVGDGTVGLPVERGRRTGRNAAGLEAVEASPHHEGAVDAAGRLRIFELVEGDERVGLGRQGGRVLEAELGLELGFLSGPVVPLLAGDLAGAAADAVGDVDERRPDRNGRRIRGSVRRRHVRTPFAARGAAARTTLTRQAFVSCVPAPGSTASIVRWLTLGPVERPWKPQL